MADSDKMMKAKILNILRNAKDYVSGQSLCDMLGVSRTAVWKNINQLKEEGYVIDAVSNKGYKISEYPDRISDTEIKSLLMSDNDELEGIIKDVVYFEETDSTNNQAKKSAGSESKPAKHGTLFITECQTGGRGRRGRTWISPAGSGIWMSLVLRPDIEPSSASMLTIVAAMAMTKAISENASKAECKIKWPNDIVLNRKKICGILTEMSAELEQIHYVVIGIGVNVNTTDFDDSIKEMASSIYLQTGRKIKRSEIVAAFSKSFEEYYNIFIEKGNLSGLKDAYNKMLINAGREVKITSAKDEFTGTATGIDDVGNLIVNKEDGSKVKVCAGEVSVRGLYGYV